MSQQMQHTGITLKVCTNAAAIVNDLLQIVDAGAIITATKVKRCDLIVHHHYSMLIEKQRIFFQLCFYFRNNLQSLFECSVHEMLIDPGCCNIHPGLDAEVVMLLYTWSM